MSCLCKANDEGWKLAEVKNDHERAIQVFTEALKEPKIDICCPKKEIAIAVVQSNLACQYGIINQKEKARELWKLSADAGDVASHYWLGCLLEKDNDIRCLSYFHFAASRGHKGAIKYFTDHPSLLRLPQFKLF